VDAVVAGAGEAIGNVSAGRLRVLAVFDKPRSQLYPNVPSTHELGYAFGAPAWSGFYGPAALPGAVAAKLTPAFRKAFESAEWSKLCEERGMEPVFMDSSQFESFALEQAAFFAEEIPKLLRMER